MYQFVIPVQDAEVIADDSHQSCECVGIVLKTPEGFVQMHTATTDELKRIGLELIAQANKIERGLGKRPPAGMPSGVGERHSHG